MLPAFETDGNLPPGIHHATWLDFRARFGVSTEQRRYLISGLEAGLRDLENAGCSLVFVDGSFVTFKASPSDFDACWDVRGVDPAKLHPVFLQFDNGRAAQKARYRGEFFPAHYKEGGSGRVFVDFFQTDKNSGSAKGIVALQLGGLFK